MPNPAKPEESTSLAEIALAKPDLRARDTVIIHPGCKTYGSIAMSDEQTLDQETRVVIKAVHPPVYRPRQNSTADYEQISPAMISWIDSASQETRYCPAGAVVPVSADRSAYTEGKVTSLGVAGLCLFFVAGWLMATAFNYGTATHEKSSVVCPKIDEERLLSVSIEAGVTRCIYGRQVYGSGVSTRAARKTGA